MTDKISLAGDLGSGKSTVAKFLMESLGAEYYSVGTIVRSLAEKYGMDVVSFNVYMETHPEIDHEVDDGLKALSDVDKPLIIDSRLAWYFTKGTFKVYLSTDIETSAVRIMYANRKGEHSATLEETVKSTKERRASEKKRYLEQYGVDIKDLMNYSLIVDTTYITPEQVAKAILSGFKKWQNDRDYKALLISPLRLNYPDDAPDGELINKYSQMLEGGEDMPTLYVAERDGEFYVDENVELALAYSFNDVCLIPASLKCGAPKNTSYTKMKNSL